jgi:hypothetical protein
MKWLRLFRWAVFGFAALLLSWISSSAFAQQRGGISQAERQQQIGKLIEDINGPDPAARIAAYEAAVSGGDQVLRRLAIQTGLSSQEQLLRESALRDSFTNRRSMVFDLSLRPQDASNPDVNSVLSAIGGRLEVYIFNFEPGGGQFLVATPFTSGEGSTTSYRFNAGLGTLAGDRLSVTFDTYAARTDRPSWAYRPVNSDGRPSASITYIRSCTANLSLLTGTLRGQIACENLNSARFTFLVTSSVMN